MRMFVWLAGWLLLCPVWAHADIMINGEPAPLVQWDELMPEGYWAILLDLIARNELNHKDE